MTVTVIIAGAFFGAGAVLAAIRLTRGPSPIDRTAALDVLLAIVVGVILLSAAVSQSATAVVIAVVVSLLGFVSSAGLALLLQRGRR
jgi:multisubunit Na+/H+ antiporter MnhF subunit